MTFVNSETVSSLAVGLLSHELSLVNTVLQVPSNEVAGPHGGKTIINVPQPRIARIQTRNSTTGVVDDLVHTPIVESPVEFDVEHVYDSAPITSHDLSLDIVDFARQVVRPLTAAVGAGAELQLANKMNSIPVAREVLEASPDNLDNQIAQAVADLDIAKVPMSDRYLAVSPSFAAALTSPANTKLTDFDGEVASEALRRGIVGEYRGMVVVKNPLLDGFRALAYHSSAFAYGSLRPADLPGAFGSSVVTEQGLSLRSMFLVDATKGLSNCMVSIFAGAAIVDLDRVVALGEDSES